jgi:predicted Zn-ribbon and HTH transcriptional regulator
MDKIATGWQCPLCKKVYSPLVSSCNCSVDIQDNIKNENNKAKANWLVWAGWAGNHDQRIEDAECSECGCVHYTVFKSLNNLSRYCPSCKSEMAVIEK